MAQEITSPILPNNFPGVPKMTTPAPLGMPLHMPSQPVQIAQSVQMAQPVLTQVQAVPAPPPKTILGIPRQKLLFFRRPERVVTVTPPPRQVVVQQPPPRFVQSQPPIRNYVRERPVEKVFSEAAPASKGCRQTCGRIPWWVYLLGLLLALALLAPLLYFLLTSPLINPAYRVYKYIYGTSYRYSYTNASETIYVPGPCYDPDDDSIELKKNATRHPLCNSTTTRVYNWFIQNSDNKDVPANTGCSVVAISERLMLFLVLSLYFSIVYSKRFFYQ